MIDGRYFKAIKRGMLPDPILTISEWADMHRILSSKASAEPGKWRTSRTPYLKEIMDCLSPSHPSTEVVFQKGTQIGATECGNNWIGYIIDCSPGPILAVQPNLELSKKNSRQRVTPLIDESPRLRGKIKSNKSRDSGNTILNKDFPGGTLMFVGAESAAGLRSMPIKYLFLDEVEGYPLDVDGEGDPIALAKKRTATFARRKIYYVSTPLFEGRSRISTLYEGTDRRKYYVPCPFCKEIQVLEWRNIVWKDKDPETVKYKCAKCEKLIDESYKKEMLDGGKWIAEKPNKRKDMPVGFHLSALYSPPGWFSWKEAVIEWLAAQKNKNKELLRVFVNTVLGETWKDKGDAPNWRRIYNRRENYKMGTVPKHGLFLTAGVDVQKDRLEIEVVAWGRNKISWSIDYIVLPGDTSGIVVWNQLDKVLNSTFKHESGLEIPIKMMAVDSGYNTQDVYNWIRKHPTVRVMAVKGVETSSMIVGIPKATDIKLSGKRYRRAVKIWPVGSSQIKTELYGWLRQEKPVEDEDFPLGYCHFPQYDIDYFKMLTAEEIITRTVKGYPRREWQKIRERNEALDCRVYARAAAAICGLDRYKEHNWINIENNLGMAIPIREKSKAKKKTRSSFWDR